MTEQQLCMKPVLIVCRAESAQQAPKWLYASVSGYRGMVSQYGVDANPAHHICLGGKWLGLCDLFRQQPKLLDEHEYFWFPDDDIQTTPEDIQRFFRLCQLRGFELAQPALTPNSFYAYRLTVGNPWFEYRLTNFVELMMPLMHKKLLIQLLPIMADKHAALGVDWLWHQLVSKPREQVAIIDSVKMGHYRPRNTHLVSRMRAHEIDLLEERKQTFKELGIKPYQHTAHAGRLLNGIKVKGLCAKLNVVMGYFTIRKKITQQRWKYKHYRAFLSAGKAEGQ